MKFAVFTVSTPTLTPEEVAPKLREYGYDGIEWRVVDEAPNPPGMGFWHGNKSTIPMTDFSGHVERMKTLAGDNNLEMPVLGTYVRSNDAWEDIEAAVQAAVALGVPKLRINVPLYDGTQPFRPVWDKAREDYKRIEELVAKNNVQALIEIHHGTICPSASATRAFVEGLDPKYVGVIHDAGNMVHEGFENLRMGFELLGEYLSHVHIKNARWFPVKYLEDKTVVWKCDWTAVHKGIVDMRQLVRVLAEIGYDGWISFEDFSTERPIDDRLKSNIEFMKKIIAEAAQESAATSGA
ncbi:MAG TPA: sugar phosphate isomerase/epimerase family protein [Thermomicrobiales bacterium]|jgi:sugar phosphate isomerase/epimerase|nr:sugar phosphate isomerase/epimerase family protein [Thermomicrobiales bacterium]